MQGWRRPVTGIAQAARYHIVIGLCICNRRDCGFRRRAAVAKTGGHRPAFKPGYRQGSAILPTLCERSPILMDLHKKNRHYHVAARLLQALIAALASSNKYGLKLVYGASD